MNKNIWYALIFSKTSPVSITQGFVGLDFVVYQFIPYSFSMYLPSSGNILVCNYKDIAEGFSSIVLLHNDFPEEIYVNK